MSSYLNLLGLAIRANKVSLGEETIVHDIRTKQATLVLIANDASSNTKKKLTDKCKSYGIPYKIVDSREEISQAIGKKNRVAVAIKDEGFTKKFLQLIND
ncbi:YlxQ family RNA-binding protein [Aquisalibacillus elongatus]|uniref:LSU ribosomal protein L7AE n=1 Tax=Aquisalibacillus elongatus TaxID=485577 RepID=A0A3N5BE08_9BACI|nr:YlxQ family RNA-binding protein [Aquisalibacillus elongatus]RPF55954.1 LSU ribosomal protein L7AE [Aquisalibacillus elongatus]